MQESPPGLHTTTSTTRIVGYYHVQYVLTTAHHADTCLTVVMFGPLDSNTAEHALVPILQLIDFGESRNVMADPAINAFQATNF